MCHIIILYKHIVKQNWFITSIEIEVNVRLIIMKAHWTGNKSLYTYVTGGENNLGTFYYHALNPIPTWISNSILYKMRNEIHSQTSMVHRWNMEMDK